MKKILVFNGLVALMLMAVFTACKKDTPAPTAEFTFLVDGSDVTFTSIVKNTSSYLWDFGDGTTSIDALPVHTYEVSGTYTVTLTVKGDGGEMTTTNEVAILPSFLEMLTGGPTATNGKTWVLSRGYIEGVDGGSGVEPDMLVLLGAEPNALDALGLASDEYDNEFTFFADGKYVINPKNDIVLASSLFGLYGGEVHIMSITDNMLGLCTTDYSVPETSTWTLNEGDLVVDAAPFGATDVPALHTNVTFTGKKWISLSEGAYFGILDFPTTRQFIIKTISPESMSVALFICAYWADPAGSGSYPNIMYHLTFVPKS